MSILLQTTYGDITIDLYTSEAQMASFNFIKLCKMKHYNNGLFYNVQKNYICEVKTKNPKTIFSLVGQQKFYFNDQISHQLKLNKVGVVATANKGPNLNNSQFFITLTDQSLISLDGKHTIFGQVVEGLEVFLSHQTLTKINNAYLDFNGRPYINIRILHTNIIYDPFDDLKGMKTIKSPEREKDIERLEADQQEEFLSKHRSEDQILNAIRQQKNKNTIEILNEIPDSEMNPPQNILFICKLNQATQQKDLELIFSRHGPIKNCQIVRDWKTGQSLQYGFIEFETVKACNEAILKMQNVLIDQRRIHVDFCQSHANLWSKFKRNKALYKSKPIFTDRNRNKQKKGKDLIPKYKEGKYLYGSNYELVHESKNRQRSRFKNRRH